MMNLTTLRIQGIWILMEDKELCKQNWLDQTNVKQNKKYDSTNYVRTLTQFYNYADKHTVDNNKMTELSSKIYGQIKLETFKVIHGKLESVMLMLCINIMFGGFTSDDYCIFFSFYWPLTRLFQWLS